MLSNPIKERKVPGQRFASLAKIVMFLREKYKEGYRGEYDLDDIIDFKLDDTDRDWLMKEALPANPKVEVIEDGMGRFAVKFRPTFSIINPTDLFRQLKRHAERGLEGILMSELRESMMDPEKVVEKMTGMIVEINRPDKDSALFYREGKKFKPNVCEEIVHLWNSVSVEACDEMSIEKHLRTEGIHFREDILAVKSGIATAPSKKEKKKKSFKATNTHVD